jgi:hypothetical protein
MAGWSMGINNLVSSIIRLLTAINRANISLVFRMSILMIIFIAKGNKLFVALLTFKGF